MKVIAGDAVRRDGIREFAQREHGNGWVGTIRSGVGLSRVGADASGEREQRITAPAFQECRATGTTDDLADSGCTNGCTRSGATNRFQPFSTVSGFDDDANAPPTTKPRFSAENEALCGESRASNVVPPTGAELPQDLAGN